MVNEKGETLEMFLKNYDPSKYERPSVTVDMAVFTAVDSRPAVLLIRRKDHPFIGSWALPGGFLNMEESLEAAAQRELQEETGVKASLTQLKAYGAVGRDPRTRVITVAYIALAKEGSIRPAAADDAADARLFTVDYRRQQEDGKWKWELQLKNDDTTLFIQATTGHCEMGLETARIESVQGDLASDHSLILFEAYHNLLQNAPERILPCLADSPTTYQKLFDRMYGTLE